MPYGVCGLRMTMRLVRLTLAVPLTRLSENVFNSARWAAVDGVRRFVNSAQIRTR